MLGLIFLLLLLLMVGHRPTDKPLSSCVVHHRHGWRRGRALASHGRAAATRPSAAPLTYKGVKGSRVSG